MKEITIRLSEIKNFFLKIKENPAEIFNCIRDEVVTSVKTYLDELMNAEITLFLGRKLYERNKIQVSKNYRNGKYERKFAIKGIGEIRVSIPRDRDGQFKTAILPRYKRFEEEINKDVIMMYLGGTSTRTVEMISEKLLGCKVSSGHVSKCNKTLKGAVENWRNRDLSATQTRYIYVDGVNFDVRLEKSVEKYPVLVAIGVDSAGYKTVLGFQGGDKESAGSWREFFRDLKSRGLKGDVVELGIMDGLPGLDKVFEDEFPKAKIQRCQVHLARNILAKVPMAIKKDVADSLRNIFYATSHKSAMKYFETFKEHWSSQIPSAVRCLEKSVEHSLTYLRFDESLWVSLRTTNPIERLNKEFKRRTKPMEIAGGEASLYNILTFISLKMELGWRKAPIKSAGKKLTALREIFTQNC